MLGSEELKQLAKSVKTFDNTKDVLEENEKKFLNGVFEISLANSEKALGKIINQTNEISNVNVEIINGTLLGETLSLDSYFVEDITMEAEDATILVEKDVVKKINVIVTEELNDKEELSEKEIATINEVLDQMIGAFAKGISRTIKYSPKIEIQAGKESTVLTKANMLQLAFSLKIGNDVDTTVYYIMPYEFINKLVGSFDSEDSSENVSTSSETETLEENVATVQPIKFEEFTDGSLAVEKENIELLMDLQLQVSVELGKVKKPIKEILQFTQGTIVELDRLAGENVDVLVSGKVIAKGEVVVVDQNFGVRITQIVIPEKRV